MKKIYLLILFCLGWQMTWADIIPEPMVKIQFVINGFDKFPDYQFFELTDNKKESIKSKQKKINAKIWDMITKNEIIEISINSNVVIAIPKGETQQYQLIINPVLVKYSEYYHPKGQPLEKILKYVKITKIEDNKIYVETEKTEFIYNDETKIEKGAITFENSIYGLISLLALLSFVFVIRFKNR